MSSHFRPLPEAAARQVLRARGGCRPVLIAAALVLSGCAAAPSRPLTGPDPADPGVRVPAVVYHPAPDEFAGARPSEPAPWRAPDSGTAPPAKKSGP
jgi:hypothetical protein